MSNKKISYKDIANEDVNFIQEMIKEYRTFGDLHNPDFEDTEKIYKALENILTEREQDKKRMQELEEENAILRKANNITKNIAKEVKIKDITQVMNKSFEEYMKDYISKQKIKDVLQNNRNELFTITYVSKEQYEPYKKQIDRINKIEQELLEGEE